MSEFEKIKSSVNEYKPENMEDLLEKISVYTYVVIYNYDGVVIEKASKITVDALKKFTEIRAFNKDGELAVRRFNDEYRGRIRTDVDGGDTEYLDEIHLLWGNENKNEALPDDYTFLLAERGMQLTVPFKIPDKEHGFIKIRNYLSNKEFQFDDWRMVDFFAQKADKEGEYNGQ